MRTDPLIARLCNELAAERRAHTILLYGSRADGSANQFSDYDVAAFADVPRTVRDTRILDGQFLDVFVHPEAILKEPTAEYLSLRDSKVLAQRGGEATEFLARLDAIFHAGPDPLPEDEIGARKVWAWKMLARMQRPDIEGNYRRTWLLTALLEDYFHIRGLWYQGPKKSFIVLKNIDAQTFSAFDAALQPNAAIHSIRQLLKLVVGEPDHA